MMTVLISYDDTMRSRAAMDFWLIVTKASSLFILAHVTIRLNDDLSPGAEYAK
jgi:hypothetical protein